MEIYLVRHGQTEWNAQGRRQGHTDIPLDETGRQQAEQLAEALMQKQITEIYCSNLKRAVETGVIIAERLGVPVYMTEGLKEFGYGRLEGLTAMEARKRYPKELALWQQNPIEYRLPGEDSETGMEVLRRSYGSWCDIIERAKGNVLIVSHGSTIQILLSYLLRDTPECIPEKIPNGCVITLRYNRLTQDICLI